MERSNIPGIVDFNATKAWFILVHSAEETGLNYMDMVKHKVMGCMIHLPAKIRRVPRTFKKKKFFLQRNSSGIREEEISLTEIFS
jgi:hypothetical protein